MPKSSPRNFEGELRLFTIGGERVAWLGDLIASARSDFKPRDFAERYLVDDMAICRYRGFRIALMEKAVFEHQCTSFHPRFPKDADGNRLMPHEDIYHLALAYGNALHTSQSNATVLAALNRLDTRYHRQFCTSLRHLIALRRGSPPPVAAAPLFTPAKPESRKENLTCEPSSTTQPTT